MNQIEIWFGIITRQAIRRGTFGSVKVLIKQIRDYITHWNANARPFHWTATADDILAKVRRACLTVRSPTCSSNVAADSSRWRRRSGARVIAASPNSRQAPHNARPNGLILLQGTVKRSGLARSPCTTTTNGP
jgi:hypothetical protein